MRKYAYLKEPVKLSENSNIYKIMLYDAGEGVYLFAYDRPDAVLSAADLFYEQLEDLYEDWNDRIDGRGWIGIEDPLPGRQHDAMIPVRVKGRDAGKPEWGRFEVLTDGKWVDLER